MSRKLAGCIALSQQLEAASLLAINKRNYPNNSSRFKKNGVLSMKDAYNSLSVTDAIHTNTRTQSYAAMAAGEPLRPFEIERRPLGVNDVLIRIKYCGICHSDIHQVRNEWGGSTFPMVPGHEITGIVEKTGADTRFRPGDHVGVGCMIDSCRECNPCLDGYEQYCERGPNFTYNSFERDGKTPTYGGYSGSIVVDQDYVLRIPSKLPLDAAAPLLCAGITTYSPLKHWKVSPGKSVAVVGLGGLGHMAVRFAQAMGARVTVLSRSPKKIVDALRLGAEDYFSTADPATFQKLVRRFDLIINTVSAKLDLNQYLELLQLEGAMVLVGVPPEAPEVNASTLIRQRRTLSGSHIGGIAETQEMLDFCGQHNIVSDIEVVDIEQVNAAYERVLLSDVRYRFVIDCQSLK
jgi:uncharacterized zinc-type alcohol dehydrogenase-like protein